MLSSDEFSLAEFGLNAEGDTWADDGTIPDCNVISESLPQTKHKIQWSQHNQQTCMWQEQAVSPVYQPTFNQAPSSAIPEMLTTPQNYQFLQNGQYEYMAFNIPAQYQQIPSSQPLSHPQFLNRAPAKHHRAQITLVHNNSNGPAKAIIKRKRKRTAFTTEQILTLEKVFCKKPYVNCDERQALVEQLQVSDRAIKVWFQNRRIKSKREEIEALSSSDYSPMGATDSSDSFGLAYVESQIYQKADEFGYVTLDDRAIAELVSAIDELIGDNVTSDILSEEEVTENVLKMEYEPVSPAANSDYSEENAAKWKPPEPEQSLRQLLYMQHFC